MSNNRDHTKTVDDMVYYGQDRSVPRELYGRSRRLFQFFWFAALSPIVLLIAGALTPRSALVQIAELFNRLFWSHLKLVTLEACVPKCHMMAYGLVAIPVSWLSTILLAIVAVILGIQNWRTGEEAIRRGGTPYGRSATGDAKQMKASIAFLFIPCCAVIGGALFGLVIFLYALAGFDHLRTAGGRIVPVFVAEVFVTVLIGAAQLLVVGLASFLTIMTITLWQSLKGSLRP
jgi:hypothetical protein